MKPSNSSRPGGGAALSLSVPLAQALGLLHEAAVASREVRRGLWEFAVEIRQLRAAGLNHSDLRRLLCQGHVRAAEETTRPRHKTRTFRRSLNLGLTERTCFVLTPAGETALRQVLAHTARPVPAADAACAGPGAAPNQRGVPRWDRTRRGLYWGPWLVKRYAVPAPNQECVLDAFEEEGWPGHLDDPLAGEAGHDPKQRLHDTIKNLNRHQTLRLLRFCGDGTGEGVCWQAVDGSFPGVSPE